MAGGQNPSITGCGMSLTRLAKETGVHKAQLSQLLREELSLQLAAAAKMCATLGLQLTGPALGRQK